MSGSLRPAVAFMIGAAFVFMGALPAAAVMTSNPTPCRASGTITDSKGTVVDTADQDAAEITIPREGRIDWQANVGKKATRYSGEFALDLDLFTYAPSAWTFRGGPQRDLANHGVTRIPSVVRYVPPGKYKVSGFRIGDDEGCDGYATLVIQGSPLTNPTGIGILAATLIALIAFVRAGTARLP